MVFAVLLAVSERHATIALLLVTRPARLIQLARLPLVSASDSSCAFSRSPQNREYLRPAGSIFQAKPLALGRNNCAGNLLSWATRGVARVQFFFELGSLVEKRWTENNYGADSFPEIAAQALVETDPSQHVDPWDIIRWCHTTPQLPSQQDVDSKFGNPPITLFAGPRFHIDVYFWVDGTTSIHQHGFSGAFQVLRGSSIHSQYRFEDEQRISDRFSVGRIVLTSVECLGQGDTRTILPGRKYIHSLFHLDRPSATITVRTYGDPGAQPQYNYEKPYFAVDPFFREPTLSKKLQTVNLLLTIKHPETDTFIGDLISSSDFHTTYLLLGLVRHHLAGDAVANIFHLSTGRERYERLIEKARGRHGHLVDLIGPVVEEQQRQSNLIQRRGYLTGSDHRFFLALLLNVPRRAMILDLVQERFPSQDPVDTVAGWVEELSTTKLLGSAEPNVLGIDALDETALLILRCRLRGLTTKQTKQAVREEYADEPADSLDNEVEAVLLSFEQSVPLKSLLVD